MASFRNPTQTRGLDNTAIRRQAKLMLPADVMLDQAEWDEILDLSNSSARLNVLRKAWLNHRRAGLPAPRMLSDGERLALVDYVTSGGARPRFARLGSGDGHFGSHWLAADDPDAPKPGPAWPETLDGDPDRYVAPKGDFAIPGVPG